MTLRQDLRTLRRRFERRPGRYRPHYVRAGVIALAALLLIGDIAFNDGHLPLTGASGRSVRAVFSDAETLTAGDPVRVAGVDVGSVSSVAPYRGGALVTMRITTPGVRLHADASAVMRWRTILGGNMYVDLNPGSNGSPPLGGRTIQLSRTQTQVMIDQLLDTFGPAQRTGAQQVLFGMAGGLRGPGAGNLIRALDRTATPIAGALQAIRGVDPGSDIPNLITRAASAMSAATASDADLAGLIDNADTTLAVTAARRADLASTLTQAPPTLSDTVTTMLRLQKTLPPLNALTVRLVPGARALDPAARAATAMFTQATPLLINAHVLLAHLGHPLQVLGDQLAPVGSEAISRLMATIIRARYQLIPFLDRTDLATNLKVYELVGPTLSSAAGLMFTQDANGASVQFHPGVGESLTGGLPCQTDLLGLNPTQKLTCEDVLAGLQSIFDPAAGPTQSFPGGVGGNVRRRPPAPTAVGAANGSGVRR